MSTSSQKEAYLIIFLGAPGSGKGTQSTLVAQQYSFARIETSKVLESWFRNTGSEDKIEIDGDTYSVREEKKKWEEGYLLPDKLVAWFIQEKLQEYKEEGKSVLLDGFPRTIGQMEALTPFLEAAYTQEEVQGIYIDIQEEEAVRRNTHRRVCELMRHSILYNTETEQLTMCPLDGSKLQVRALDDPEAIKIRFQEYKNKTLPLLEYFKEHDIRIHTVEAERTPHELFQDVSQVIENIKRG